jgi:hypothetical protein
MIAPYYWLWRSGRAYKNLQHISYLSRHRLLIKLVQAESEIDFLHKTTRSNANNPRSPQSHTGAHQCIEASRLSTFKKTFSETVKDIISPWRYSIP